MQTLKLVVERVLAIMAIVWGIRSVWAAVGWFVALGNPNTPDAALAYAVGDVIVAAACAVILTTLWHEHRHRSPRQ